MASINKTNGVNLAGEDLPKIFRFILLRQVQKVVLSTCSGMREFVRFFVNMVQLMIIVRNHFLFVL